MIPTAIVTLRSFVETQHFVSSIGAHAPNIVDNVDERVIEYSSEHKGSSFFDLDYYQLIILKRSGN